MLQSREAEQNELLLAHSKEHVDEMFNLQKLTLPELSEKEKSYDSVYLTADTYKVSTLATGCLLQVFTCLNIIKNCINFLPVVNKISRAT